MLRNFTNGIIGAVKAMKTVQTYHTTGCGSRGPQNKTTTPVKPPNARQERDNTSMRNKRHGGVANSTIMAKKAVVAEDAGSVFAGKPISVHGINFGNENDVPWVIGD